MTRYKKSLGIVCPIANEELTIEKFIHEIIKEASCFDKFTLFIIMDDSSVDNTINIIKKMLKDYSQLSLVYDPSITSVAKAYIRGYMEAIQYDWVLEIDAGFSQKPSEMHRFFDLMDQGKDCVFGTRFGKGGIYKKQSSFKRRLLSRSGTFITNKLLGTRLTDMTSSFECFKGSVLNQILKKGIRSNGPFIQTEIKFHAHKYDIAEVPITYSNPSNNIKLASIIEALRILFELAYYRYKST